MTYRIARELGGHIIYAAERSESTQFYDDAGALLLKLPRPEPGAKYVSNGGPRGAGNTRTKNIRDIIQSTGTVDPPGEYRRTVRTGGRVSVRNVFYGIGKAL